MDHLYVWKRNRYQFCSDDKSSFINNSCYQKEDLAMNFTSVLNCVSIDNTDLASLSLLPIILKTAYGKFKSATNFSRQLILPMIYRDVLNVVSTSSEAAFSDRYFHNLHLSPFSQSVSLGLLSLCGFNLSYVASDLENESVHLNCLLWLNPLFFFQELVKSLTHW